MIQFQRPFEVASIIKIGDKHPIITKAISRTVEVDSFTSSPCLLHDCFTFIRVSVINSYYYTKRLIQELSFTHIFITLITVHNQNI